MTIKDYIKITVIRLIKSLQLDRLLQRVAESREQEVFNQNALASGATFHSGAKVYNFQNDILQIKVGKNSHVRGEILIFGYGGYVEIGENCYVGEYSKIWSGEKVIIENNVLISHNVNIIDTNSHEINEIERAQSYQSLLVSGQSKIKGNVITSPIHIKENAWINFNSIILKGVTIGKGAIIAAGSVVTKDVPDYAVVAGNPAEIKKYNF